MTRFHFAGKPGDSVAAAYDASGLTGDSGLVFLAAPANATVSMWTAQTGGTQVTDLIDYLGRPTSLIPVVDGQVTAFQGPDDSVTTALWGDGGGPRTLFEANDAYDARLANVEAAEGIAGAFPAGPTTAQFNTLTAEVTELTTTVTDLQATVGTLSGGSSSGGVTAAQFAALQTVVTGIQSNASSQQTEIDGLTTRVSALEQASQQTPGPVADVEVTSSGLTVNADASQSTAGALPILSYAWSWGDGATTPAGTATGAAHTYAASGTYTVTVTVTDGTYTATDTASVTVTAATATGPTASFTLTALGAIQTVTDTSAAGDAALNTVLITWNDGTSVTVAPGGSANKQATAVGTKTVTILVTDKNGLTDTAQQNLVLAGSAYTGAQIAGSSSDWTFTKGTDSTATVTQNSSGTSTWTAGTGNTTTAAEQSNTHRKVAVQTAADYCIDFDYEFYNGGAIYVYLDENTAATTNATGTTQAKIRVTVPCYASTSSYFGVRASGDSATAAVTTGGTATFSHTVSVVYHGQIVKSGSTVTFTAWDKTSGIGTPVLTVTGSDAKVGAIGAGYSGFENQFFGANAYKWDVGNVVITNTASVVNGSTTSGGGGGGTVVTTPGSSTIPVTHGAQTYLRDFRTGTPSDWSIYAGPDSSGGTYTASTVTFGATDGLKIAAVGSATGGLSCSFNQYLGVFVWRMVSCTKPSGTLATSKNNKFAILLWPQSNKWADGELDVGETDDARDVANFTAHWDGVAGHQLQIHFTMDTTQPHDYGMLWSTTQVQWFIDGVIVGSIANGTPSGGAGGNVVLPTKAMHATCQVDGGNANTTFKCRSFEAYSLT